MAQLTSQHQTITNFTYTPPRLPAYLANTYVLKPIIGLSADEEIKTIHAIIREVNGVSHSESSMYQSYADELLTTVKFLPSTTLTYQYS
jgi:hypothetical protein